VRTDKERGEEGWGRGRGKKHKDGIRLESSKSEKKGERRQVMKKLLKRPLFAVQEGRAA